MPDCAVVRSDMAEYWHVIPERQAAIDQYLATQPEPEVTLHGEIAKKDFVNAGKGSYDVKNTLKRLGVDPDTLRRIAVAAYEAEINVAAHSRGGRMTSMIFDDMIHIRYEDQGPGIADISQAMTPGYSTADDLVREMGFGAGLGLPNIKKNADALHIVSDADSPTTVEIMVFFA